MMVGVMTRLGRRVILLTWALIWGGVVCGSPFDIDRLKALRAQFQTTPLPLADPTPEEPETRLVLFRPQHVAPQDVKQLVMDLIPGITVGVEGRSRTVGVVGTPAEHRMVSRLMSYLDVMRPQIDIEVSILEVSGSSADMMTAWLANLSEPVSITTQFQPFSVVSTTALQGLLAFVKSQGRNRLVSQPRFTTLENRKARFKVGDREPYLTTIITNNNVSTQVGHAETGVDLEITPWMTGAGIGMDIYIQMNHIKRFRALDKGQYPVVSHRMVQNEVVVPVGHSVIIAGFLDNQVQASGSKVPLLSDIPLLGSLMSSTQEQVVSTDILIAITPRHSQKTNKEALR